MNIVYMFSYTSLTSETNMKAMLYRTKVLPLFISIEVQYSFFHTSTIHFLPIYKKFSSSFRILVCVICRHDLFLCHVSTYEYNCVISSIHFDESTMNKRHVNNLIGHVFNCIYTFCAMVTEKTLENKIISLFLTQYIKLLLCLQIIQPYNLILFAFRMFFMYQ